MTEKYRLQFRFLNGFIPPEMVVDVSEMGLPSACQNLFAVAKAHNWQGEILVLELHGYSEPGRVQASESRRIRA